MDKLQLLYIEAIEQTKRKITEDLIRFLGKLDDIPSFEEYINSRNHYIEQIWMNVWLNKVNNLPKRDKKAYLKEKDYVVGGVDRKLINQLFRNEMREYQPFEAYAWIEQEFAFDQEKWEERYAKARELFLQAQQQEKLAAEKKELQKKIEKISKDYIENQHILFYLLVRKHVAEQVQKDVTQNQKYKRVETFRIEETLIEEGEFQPTEYTRLSQFFEELTGAVHQTFDYEGSYWEYETYYYTYERLVSLYLNKIIPFKLLEELPAELVTQYDNVSTKPLSARVLKELLAEKIFELESRFLAELETEYIIDLLRIAEVPFDEEVHRTQYEQDVQERKRRAAEEEAERIRRKQEEERILNDIFGQEYSPSLRGNIRYVLHIGETNTGKTYHALQRMMEARSGLYLAPLRLLALEVFDKLNAAGVPCNLKTGEEEKTVEHAEHISCTVEMFHEKDAYDVVVIDEAQMMADKDRGFSWYKAITKANAHEVHIIGSKNVKNMILQLLGDSDIEVNEYERDIPLQVEQDEFSLKNTKQGDALVCFSRRRVLETASKLQNRGQSVSMIYGSMPPETRKKQMLRFIKGETKVIVSTDAIGMGLNLPIRRIVFLENEKFDGTRKRTLTSQEIKQIAGRAGRKGLYNVGKVAFTKDIKRMERLLEKEDQPVQTFSIAPTNSVLERFQRHYRDLGTFFELWNKFESPKGTEKSTLFEERELYELVRGTEIEAKLSLMDLYGFLHLPFSKKEPELTRQWLDTMFAIIDEEELPEPKLKNRNLEDLEVSYKALGLHLLFLYRLGRQTEAVYWERVRENIANGVHEKLKTEVETERINKCRKCERKLPADFKYPICDACHAANYRRRHKKSNRYYRKNRS